MTSCVIEHAVCSEDEWSLFDPATSTPPFTVSVSVQKERKAPVIGECRCDSATNTGIQHREDDQDESVVIWDIISSHDLYIVLISMALLDKHLRPTAKFLGVPRYASKNKNWLFFELASRMLARKWVSITGEKGKLIN